MISPKIASILRLLDSDHPGESEAALAKARLLLRREGHSFGDLSRALEGHVAPRQPQRGASWDDVKESADDILRRAAAEAERGQQAAAKERAAREAAAAAAWEREQRARREEEERRNAPLRAEVIARYGSKEAVEAFTANEMTLRRAVRRWSVFCDPPHARLVRSVDGTTDAAYRAGDMSPRVVDALSHAIPLPKTITEAKAELDRWERRDRDLGLISNGLGDCQLDLPSQLRRNIVREIFEETLRAATLDEALVRQRYLVEQGYVIEKLEQAILADLESLAAAARTPAPSSPAKGQEPPRHRRAQRTTEASGQADLFYPG